MIKLKTLKWSNVFSYGADNEIDFSKVELTQLIGKNGHGKSSIALILEEVLYNKNSKNTKKANIINRYLPVNSYSIELSFSKDGSEYLIKTVRGSTQTVKLFCDGKDISSHTSTGTYKLIEDIIGFDHKTFTQIVYQTSAASLEFLTATDTARKKFLIDLLNLTRYTKASDIFKALAKEATEEVEVIQLKIGTIKDWLNKLNKEDLVVKPLLPIPNPPVEEANTLSILEEQLKNIDDTNKKITQNNKYKEILDNISIELITPPTEDINVVKLEYSELLKKKASLEKTISGTGPILDKCTLCGQPINNEHLKIMVEEARTALSKLKSEEPALHLKITTMQAYLSRYNKSIQSQQDLEKYHSLYVPSMSTKILDRGDLESKIKQLQSYIRSTNTAIISAQNSNNSITAHNTKIEVLKQQMSTMNVDLEKHNKALSYAQNRLGNLQILVKTFSTTGLIAYKIECLVKDLEKLVNEYLLDMSDGRFQLSFKVNSSDKLNVVINDNGKDVDITDLSNGERARVNVSTLLAIRKLMLALSNSRINLLILDETIENLDAEGKERLIEVLLREEYLNTILISHGFSHPLLEKIHIVKENNISRIE